MGTSLLSNALLVSKFRGCMIGALLGDCLGGPFEFDNHVSTRVLGNYFTNLLKGESNQLIPYTDDTEMTLSVARSLVEKEKLDSTDIAKRFVSEFYNPPKRGYGEHVIDVFRTLKETEFKDVFLPAKLQFNGSGSYGNGAAMRIAPVALFGNNQQEEYIKMAAEEVSRITHTHPFGYNGAVLQCLAIRAALKLDATKELNRIDFIESLQEKIGAIESENSIKPYSESLIKMKKIYLKNQQDISAKEIGEYLGNAVSAHRSVPTAIYSFLRGFDPIPEFECVNPFVRTIYFAISVGGDTDTIASMAGSIAGAYHGADVIPETLQRRCELIDEVIRLASKLADISVKEMSSQSTCTQAS